MSDWVSCDFAEPRDRAVLPGGGWRKCIVIPPPSNVLQGAFTTVTIGSCAACSVPALIRAVRAAAKLQKFGCEFGNCYPRAACLGDWDDCEIPDIARQAQEALAALEAAKGKESA